MQRLGNLAAEDHIRTAEANTGAGISIALDDKQAALRPVSEALADGAIQTLAVVIQAFEYRDCTAARALGDTILRAAFSNDIDRSIVEGAQPVPRNRRVAETEVNGLQLIYIGEPGPLERATQVRAQRAIRRRDILIFVGHFGFALGSIFRQHLGDLFAERVARTGNKAANTRL